jgi:hypothetical protein
VLGHKKLTPQEVLSEFDRLESKARDTLDKNSFPFEFGGARFVPKKRMPEFVSEINDVIVAYSKLADDLVENYDEYRIETRKEYVAAAHAAYAQVKATHKGFSKTKDEFVNEFLARIETFYPKKEDLRTKYSMDYTVFQVALPDVSQASYADVAEDAEKLQLMKDAYEHSLERKMNLFVDRVASELRAEAEEVLSNFIHLLEHSRTIRANCVEAVRNLIHKYEDMDIIGDVKIVEMLKDFRTRALDGYTFRDLRDDEELKKSVISELKMLVGIIADKAGIEALRKEYRVKLGM